MSLLLELQGTRVENLADILVSRLMLNTAACLHVGLRFQKPLYHCCIGTVTVITCPGIFRKKENGQMNVKYCAPVKVNKDVMNVLYGFVSMARTHLAFCFSLIGSQVLGWNLSNLPLGKTLVTSIC